MAEDNKPGLLKTLSRELFDTEESMVAKGKKKLRDKVSELSDEYIREPITKAGYPNVANVAAAVPETVVDVAVPSSGMELLPTNKIMGTFSKGGKALSRLTDAEKGAKKAMDFASNEKRVMNTVGSYRADSAPALTKAVEAKTAEAKELWQTLNPGKTLSKESEEAIRNTARERLSKDPMALAQSMKTETQKASIVKDLKEPAKVEKQVFQKKVSDDNQWITPAEKERIMRDATIGSREDRLQMIELQAKKNKASWEAANAKK